MDKKSILQQLHFIKQCKKWGLTIWECPSFLFIVMGIVTILAMLGTYIIASQYENPDIAIMSVTSVTIIILIVGSFVVKGTEKIAEANRMKSEFLSIASHELKSPLTGIKWTIDLLLSGKDSGLGTKQLESLRSIRENNDRSMKLVSDLLNVSRIEQNRMKIMPEVISLGAVVKELVKESMPFAEAHNVSINFTEEPNLPDIKADPQKIKSVVQNLLGNAIKYIKGKGKIEISLKKEKNSVCFRIKDDGVGIPAHQQKAIFTKFFRASNALKNQTQGTGLGLYIAKAIMKKSGGEIGFISKEEEGTTFWFAIPAFQETGENA